MSGVFNGIGGSGSSQVKFINRTNGTRGIAPTVAELANPKEGASVIIRLPDDSLEHWDYNGGGWILKFTDDDLSIIPEFNSMADALTVLGPEMKFRYSEINIDGVTSPNGSTTAITKN